ncbi:glutathione S-transferase [Paraburkholderia phenoliruptrix]|nr:glutathione S-transferase [Paraburkholderia phenoliruptrix]
MSASSKRTCSDFLRPSYPTFFPKASKSQTGRIQIRTRAAKAGQPLERALSTGPYFGGELFCIVDAAFGPVFRYFVVFEQIDDFGFFAGGPKVSAWPQRLAERPSVRAAAGADCPQLLMDFLLQRGSALSVRIRAQELPGPDPVRNRTESPRP